MNLHFLRLLGPGGLVLVTLSTTCVLDLFSQTTTFDQFTSYQTGDTIDPDTFVLDRKLQVVLLTDLIRPQTKVAVLIIFGGAVKEIPKGAFRGNLWCEDSFDDLGVQRALAKTFQGKAVQFIPVAVPPVYDPTVYGYAEDVFLGQSEESTQYRLETESFIEATEALVRTGLLPFSQVYYDPKFRLAQNSKVRQLGPEYGKIYKWQGRLKWRLDSRKYGTPSFWLLGPRGEILQEPFFGNDYDSSPPRITYGYREVKEAIEIHVSR